MQYVYFLCTVTGASTISHSSVFYWQINFASHSSSASPGVPEKRRWRHPVIFFLCFRRTDWWQERETDGEETLPQVWVERILNPNWKFKMLKCVKIFDSLLVAKELVSCSCIIMLQSYSRLFGINATQNVMQNTSKQMTTHCKLLSVVNGVNMTHQTFSLNP